MPRLTSLADKLITAGSKRSPVYVRTYTGTNFSAVHSTWTFILSTATTGSSTVTSISLRSSGIPYHAYGNTVNTNTVQVQNINKIWPFRAGTNQGPNTSTRIISITTSSKNNSGTVIVTTSTATIIGTFSISISTGSTIGYWLNGVSMYSPSAGSEAPKGYLTFKNLNYNAAYDEDLYYSFYLQQDNAGGHWLSDGVYHYHNFNFDYAWLNGAGIPNNYAIPHTSTAPASPALNDLWYDTNVSALKVWTGALWRVAAPGEVGLINYLGGSLTQADGHSKILGWSLDGYPVYGPYGYNQPLDPNSGVRSMVSGYTLYDNVQKVKARIADGATNTDIHPFGMFIQDFYYIGTGDLDQSNGRYCVTPDYPAGTYAYFVTINTSTGRTAYPYIIGDYYKSTPSLGSNTATDFTSGGGLAPKQTS
jgi:YHYH protein